MKTYFILIYTLCFSFLGYSQKQRLKKADNLYLIESYAEASKTYEDVLERRIDSNQVAKNLAHSYFVIRENKKALEWHNYLYKEKMLDSISFARYMNLKMSTSPKETLISLVNEAISLFPESKYFQGLKKDLTAEESNELPEDFFTLQHLNDVNSSASEFGVSYYRDGKVLLTSSKRLKKVVNRKDERSNDYFYNLYKAKVDKDDLGEITFEKSPLTSKFHDGPACYDSINDYVYFTRNNIDGEKAIDEFKKVTHLKIMRGQIVNGEIVNVQSLPFNSDLYSTMHPAISADGKYLFFSSNMPGGYGGFDLYVVEINKQGLFGKPQNLGGKINTLLDDVFPYYQQNGDVLFYSSNGHLGYGGLDIFYAELSDDLTPLTLSNCGASINSGLDDFSFINNSTQSAGFISSNRLGGEQKDDIYSFTQKEPLSAIYYWLLGTVSDRDSDELLNEVAVSITDQEENLVFRGFTNDNGVFETEKLDGVLKGDSLNYRIKLSKEDYISQTFPFNLETKDEQELNINSYLSLKLKKIEIGETDLAEVANINPIYFDYDKANIRKDAAEELDKVVEILKDNPGMIIELGAHTDSRGNPNYNLELSNRRAQSSVEYIISQGIEKYRIFGTGYGELIPKVPENEINNVTDEEEKERLHQLNRRTEFIIMEMGEKKYVSSDKPPEYVDMSKLSQSNERAVKRASEKSVFKDRKGKEVTGKEYNKDNIKNGYYIVLPHETLYRIQVNTGVRVEELKRLNGLESNHIETGQKILIR